MILATILKFYIFSALCTELMLVLRRQKFLAIWFPVLAILINIHFNLEYTQWDTTGTTPEWMYLLNNFATSLLLPLVHLFFCNECKIKKNTTYTYTLFALGLLSFLPSVNICLDYGTIGAQAPFLRGIQIFYGGKRAAFWNSYSPTLICQGYMVATGLWSLRMKMKKQEWKMSENGRYLFLSMCAIVFMAMLTSLLPHTLWEYEVMKYVYFSVIAILLVVSNTMVGLGYSLAPIVDEEDVPVFVETEPKSTSGRAAKELDKLMEVERIYLNPNLTLEDLSKRLYTNRSYLTRLIRERYGKTFVDVVREKRIAYAKEYMKDHHEKLDVIALETGFNSASTFCKAFKAVTGETPAAWAKRSALTDFQLLEELPEDAPKSAEQPQE